jgi:hypothetical protein
MDFLSVHFIYTVLFCFFISFIIDAIRKLKHGEILLKLSLMLSLLTAFNFYYQNHYQKEYIAHLKEKNTPTEIVVIIPQPMPGSVRDKVLNSEPLKDFEMLTCGTYSPLNQNKPTQSGMPITD